MKINDGMIYRALLVFSRMPQKVANTRRVHTELGDLEYLTVAAVLRQATNLGYLKVVGQPQGRIAQGPSWRRQLQISGIRWMKQYEASFLPQGGFTA